MHETPPDKQMEIFALEDLSGFGTLKAREQAFVAALFEGCTQREAAKRAGIQGEDNAVDVAASKLVRRGKVQAIMAQAWARSGADVSRTLRQAAELATQAFDEVKRAQTREEREPAFRRWREASALIATIHGKIGLKISGSIEHRFELTDEDRRHLADLAAQGVPLTMPERAGTNGGIN